jgi:hypothetical protein
MTQGRCIFTTLKGYVGLGLESTKPGDVVCVLLGCKSTMVLRKEPYEVGDYFKVIGESYVDGLAEAQALLGPLLINYSFVY